MAYTWTTFKNAVKALMSDVTISDDTAVRAIAEYVRAKALNTFGGDPNIYTIVWSSYLEQRKNLLGYTVTLDSTTLRARIRELLTDTTISDETAVLAIADFVKAGICRQVDKNPALADSHFSRWQAQRNRLLGYTITLTHDLLRADVNKLLTVDATRRGIEDFVDELVDQANADLAGLTAWVNAQIDQAKIDLAGSATFIDKSILSGVIELQHFVPFYRQNHETDFAVADTTEFGEACTGTLPEGCMIQDAYYVSDDDPCVRMPVTQYDWQNRFDLKCGTPRMDGSRFFMAIDPSGSTFTLFPALLDGNHLEVFWDGTKSSFLDGDSVPFDDAAAQAIADYVQVKLYTRPSSFNAKLAAYHQAEHEKKRKQLYVDSKDRLRIRFLNESDYPEPLTGCAGCAVLAS